MAEDDKDAAMSDLLEPVYMCSEMRIAARLWMQWVLKAKRMSDAVMHKISGRFVEEASLEQN